MAPKKPALKRPAPSADELHRKITGLVENMRSNSAKRQNSNQKTASVLPKKIKFVEPMPPVAPKDLADNEYAHGIFMCKTNVRQVARETAEREGWKTTEEYLRAYRKKLYRRYVLDPKERIRDPLYKVRFENEYYEYRFFLAVNKPLHSQEEYDEYKEQLEAAGIGESWVSMRPHNPLLKYEEKIVKKLQKDFVTWSMKLGKLDHYMMDLHRKHESKAAASKATTGDDQLLEDLLKRSNALKIFSEAQVRARFHHIKRYLLGSDVVGYRQWLVFDDDKLNERFQLGTQRPKATAAEIEEVEVALPQESFASSSRPSSVASGDSEIAQMRSDMAMTQPQELPPMEKTRFADTIELISVLGTVEEPPLPEMGNVDERPVGVEPIVVTEEPNPELSPMITPAQADVVEISDSPVKEGDLVEVKEEFIFTLDYMKKYTNMEQFVIDQINQNSPQKAKELMPLLDRFVEKYYEFKKSMLLQNVLPEELRMLSRKERRERQAKVDEFAFNKDLPAEPSTASDAALQPLPIQAEISPHTETPSVPRVPRRSRLIVYSEDEPEQQPNEPPADLPEDTLPMPHSEDFLPSVFSTQLPDDGGVPPRRQDTPFQSPVKPVTPRCTSAASSRGPTPAFAAHSPDVTVIANTNEEKSPAIKRELNSTSYEGEVEFVELNDGPIVIQDSMDVTSQNIPELLERQPSALAAMPDALRGLVNTLFQENRDPTLSQGSGASSGASSGKSRLSQDTANVSPVGFHQATALTQNSDNTV